VLEDRVLVAANAAGVRRFRAPLGSILAFITRHAWRALLGRFRRFGMAAVHFGEPVSLSSLMKASAFEGDGTEFLARTLMRRISADMPALGVPLVAAVWDTGPIDRDALIGRVEGLSSHLASRGAQVVLPDGGAAEAVDSALKVFAIRRMVSRAGSAITVDPSAAPLLDFYAASVRQTQEVKLSSDGDAVLPQASLDGRNGLRRGKPMTARSAPFS
jgi:glycerol-3-phosphate O-acyltransferase